MSKFKSAYFCQNCGHQSAKWLGKCPSCEQWNTLVEEVLAHDDTTVPGWHAKLNSPSRANKPNPIPLISFSHEQRLETPDKELNRVLGGGIVPGSLILIGGEPGIGKSTLMLQAALGLGGQKILYVSGEESEQQIKMRAERLSAQCVSASTEEIYILAETSMQNIFKQVERLAPQLIIIDSIQTLYSAHLDASQGSISQIRECTAQLLRFAKESAIPVILIGHITKEGVIAGPKVLEHMVDTVLQFEGDRHHVYRILRTMKNRFGSTFEIGIYEMQGSGLRQVSNPSEILLSQRQEALSGITIAAVTEGMRPMLVETQALVSHAAYGTPQRSATGFDAKRLNMLLAVLEKRCGFMLGNKDVFLNIAGGLRIEDPSIDLAIIMAIVSSHENQAISPKTCFAAEVGLSGEIRAVTRVEQRIAEAEKLGFERIYISKYNQKGLDNKRYSIDTKFVSKVEEVISLLEII